MKTVFALLLIVTGVFVYIRSQRPIVYPPGVLIDSEPTQTMLAEGEPTIEHGEYHLKPLARFSIDARLLHRKAYGYDRQSKLVPMDLAVGWGPMSDQAVLDQMTITQSMRFFWYEYQTPPIPKDEIISHSTNIHIIPATPAVARFCKSLRQGELIHLEGELVEATGADMAGPWRSSLIRTDTGNGACELMLVEDFSKFDAEPAKSIAALQR